MKHMLITVVTSCAILCAHAQFDPPQIIHEFPTNNYLFQLADFDGNGQYDVIFKNVIVYNQEDLGGTTVPHDFDVWFDPVDFNGDGLDDLISVKDLYLSNGLGEFEWAYIFEDLEYGDFVDVDLDGDIDVVSNGDSWYENLGDGNFMDHNSVFEEMNFRFMGDLDSDGLSDAISWNYFGTVTWNRQLTQGVFGPEEELLDFDSNSFEEEGFMFNIDFDGDGDQDIAYQTETDQFWWVENIGDEQFGDADPWITQDLKGLRKSDFDGDGDVDIILAKRSGCGLQYCENNGGISFPQNLHCIGDGTDGYGFIQSYDTDGDGLQEIFCTVDDTGAIDHFHNDGNWEVTRNLPLATGYSGANEFDIRELNGDGHPDICFWTDWSSHNGFTVSNIYQTGELEFSANQITTHVYEHADNIPSFGNLNEDPFLDAIVNVDDDELQVWLSNDQGYLELSQSTTAYNSVDNVVLADMDYDGDQDAMINQSAGCGAGLAAWENEGNGVFSSGFITTMCESDVLPLDMDGDNDLDFVLPYGVVFEQLSLTEFEAINVSSMSSIQYVDLNDDGLPDLLGFGPNEVEIEWNQGDLNFSEPQQVFSAGDDYVLNILTMDADADGDFDILLNTLAGLVLIENLSAGEFSGGSSINIELEGVFRSGDIDADGDEDIVVKDDEFIFLITNNTLIVEIIVDVNEDGVVSIEDLLDLIADLGCQGDDCLGDLDGDGFVSILDLLEFLTVYP